MVYPAHVVHTLIASPSDVSDARQALRAAIWEFNDENTEANQVVLLPRLWEHNSTPRLGADPQAILDEQIVDSSDIVIGIFWTRIGQLLADGTAATVHELERFVDAGKPALLYFSNVPVVPGSIDVEQWNALLEFKERAKSWGIYREFGTTEEFVTSARRHLLDTVRNQLRLPQVTAPTAVPLAARPVASVDRRQVQKVDSKKNLKIDNRTYLILTNHGEGVAKNMSLSWVEPDDAPIVYTLEEPITSFVAGAKLEYQVLDTASMSNVDLLIEWDDDNGEHSKSVQTVRF
ncbi:hypothetical protein [Rhodococcus qingshengii]|uniref:hypothetical protein n=1 Tax=Rhodococcus qingshengii TaxID=334542 RepID=UPI00237CCD36|nr:hypothetical protein [Rhodococcus qingshengii]WCT06087.1 hypothetical protein PI247_31300 [Rhodococcus qingshengii]